MDRRDAIKALGSLVTATGLQVTPVTVQDATDVTLIILKPTLKLPMAGLERLRDTWQHAVAGTALEKVKMVIMSDEVDIEFVLATGGKL